MLTNNMALVSELSDTELDAVGGGTNNIVVGSPNVAIVTQTNLAVLNFKDVAQSNNSAVAQSISAGGYFSGGAWAKVRSYTRA